MATTLKKMEAEQLRNRLLVQIKEFQDLLIAYYEEPNPMGEREKQEAQDRISKHLSSESKFTAFKRDIVKRMGVVSDFDFN